MEAPILAPAAVLVLWTLLIMFWMAITRFRAFSQAGIDLAAADPGARYADIEPQLPPSVNWKSHNYTHLLEQPTLFSGVVAILALSGQGDGLNATLAWGYVILRIVHSLWQCLINKVPVRFGLFLLSSLLLLTLAINAVRATLL